jgi:hypothetical protein
MKSQISYSSAVRKRAVRLLFEQQKEHERQWLAIKSIASKISCQRQRCGHKREERRRIRELERENLELTRANEILRKAKHQDKHQRQASFLCLHIDISTAST